MFYTLHYFENKSYVYVLYSYPDNFKHLLLCIIKCIIGPCPIFYTISNTVAAIIHEISVFYTYPLCISIRNILKTTYDELIK